MRILKAEQKKIAGERIAYLFEQAGKVYKKDAQLADRYVEIALDLRNKFKIRLLKKHKIKFCKKCHSFLMPGDNCKVRKKQSFALYHCDNCGHINRH
jgi:ribonuclease P protein subunit RPR2